MRLWLLATWGLLACLAVLLLGSCSNTTEPTDDRPRVSFSPDQDEITVPLDDVVTFRVLLENATGAVVQFCRGDSVLVVDQEYYYEGLYPGPDSLCAIVTLPDAVYHKEWRIWVDSQNADLPPVVPDQAVTLGPTPGSIIVSWTQPPAAVLPRPLANYLVAVRQDSSFTEADWDEAVILEQVDHVPGPAIGYARTYDDGEFPDIVAGEQVMVAVRARDVAGLLSPLESALRIRVSAPYSLRGYVRKDTGEPLPGVIVDYGCDTCRTATDLAGWFELGPFRDVDEYVITTLSRDVNSGPEIIDAYYDFRSDTLGVDSPQPLAITLISRWGMDPDCASSFYGDDFLTYFMQITRTDQAFTGRPNQKLLKWDSYPIAVYVHQATSDDGSYELGPIGIQAITMWNEKMPEDYFFQVDQPEIADMEIIFTNTGMGTNHGIAQIVNGGIIYKINEVIPDKMHVKVRTNLTNPRYTLEVLLHEIGHGLCLGAHSNCASLVHLMGAAPSGIINANWPDSPINDDEAHAVQAIRYLPQGTPMDRFIVE